MTDQIIGWCVTVLVVGLVVSFIIALVAVARLPDERPEVVTYDRFGGVIGAFENPGPSVGPGRGGDPIEARQQRHEQERRTEAPS